MTIVTNKYLLGFNLLTDLVGGLKTYPVAASVTVAKGDFLQDNGSGFAQLGTGLATTGLGVAVADADNSSGIAGAINVQVIPIHSQHQFIVPVEANTVIARTNVGTIVDLESEDGIDIGDVTVTANGFKIDDFDASTDAVAANTNGFAIGHFEAVS